MIFLISLSPAGNNAVHLLRARNRSLLFQPSSCHWHVNTCCLATVRRRGYVAELRTDIKFASHCALLTTFGHWNKLPWHISGDCRIEFCFLTGIALHMSHARSHGWRRGVVASVVRRMNEVTLYRAWLVLGWVTVIGRVYHHGL